MSAHSPTRAVSVACPPLNNMLRRRYPVVPLFRDMHVRMMVIIRFDRRCSDLVCGRALPVHHLRWLTRTCMRSRCPHFPRDREWKWRWKPQASRGAVLCMW